MAIFGGAQVFCFCTNIVCVCVHACVHVRADVTGKQGEGRVIIWAKHGP